MFMIQTDTGPMYVNLRRVFGVQINEPVLEDGTTVWDITVFSEHGKVMFGRITDPAEDQINDIMAAFETGE